MLARSTDDFCYANLAVRGRKLRRILDEQIEPALALEPDLVTSYAGANDILFTAFDPGGSAIYRPMRGRFALYTEAVREIPDRHQTHLVDFWRMREYRDFGYWDTDRMHLGPAGHQRMAMAVLDALGVAHDLEPLPPTAYPELTGRELRAKNLEWARTHAAPWVHRRITGRSSGDDIAPKRPGLAPI